MPKTRSSKVRKGDEHASTTRAAKKKEGGEKKYWKTRLGCLCKQIGTLEKQMIPPVWKDASYDLFDACRVERSELITRLNWILHTKFDRPPNPAFHRSTQIEVALSLLN